WYRIAPPVSASTIASGDRSRSASFAGAREPWAGASWHCAQAASYSVAPSPCGAKASGERASPDRAATALERSAKAFALQQTASTYNATDFEREMRMRWILTALLPFALQAAPPNLPPAYPRAGATKILDNARVQVWNIAWLKGQPSPLH